MERDTYAILATLEHDWAHAWLNGNEALCDYLMGEDFVEVSANGRFTSKAEWLAAIDTGRPRQIGWIDIRVRPFGRFAVVHGKLRLLRGVDGHDQRNAYLVTDVWACRGDQWRIVSRHLTAAHAHDAHLAAVA